MHNIDLFPKGCLYSEANDATTPSFWLVSLKTLWGDHLVISPQPSLWIESVYKFWHNNRFPGDDWANNAALNELIEATLKAGPYYGLED